MMDNELYERIVMSYSAEQAKALVDKYGVPWLAEVEDASNCYDLCDPVIACWADMNGIDPDEDPEEVGLTLGDNYMGEHESPEEWAREEIEALYTIPDFLVGHVDYGSIARDHRYGGDVTFLRVGDPWSVHVFSNH